MMSSTGFLLCFLSSSQLGDLNYRITSDVPTPTVFQFAQSNFAALLKKDQLTVSQQAGFAFVDFIEPPIAFPPTYKYLREASLYDQRPEKKLRAPAWCDRVLYHLRDPPRPNQQNPVVITDYDAVRTITGSDHKPVYLRSVCFVKKYDAERMVECQQKAKERLIAGESEGLLAVEVSSAECSFGPVAFQTAVRRSVRLENRGEVNVYFRFLPRDSANHVALPLFTVSQLFGVLLPHQSVDLTITLFVSTPFLKVFLIPSMHHSTSTPMEPLKT